MSKLREDMILILTSARNLLSVTDLNYRGGQLSDCSIITHMPNIRILDLSNNNINTLIYFKDCYFLQKLNICGNNIKDFSELGFLQSLKQLKQLELDRNPCASEENYPQKVLRLLPALKTLDRYFVTSEDVHYALTLDVTTEFDSHKSPHGQGFNEQAAERDYDFTYLIDVSKIDLSDKERWLYSAGERFIKVPICVHGLQPCSYVSKICKASDSQESISSCSKTYNVGNHKSNLHQTISGTPLPNAIKIDPLQYTTINDYNPLIVTPNVFHTYVNKIALDCGLGQNFTHYLLPPKKAVISRLNSFNENEMSLNMLNKDGAGLCKGVEDPRHELYKGWETGKNNGYAFSVLDVESLPSEINKTTQKRSKSNIPRRINGTWVSPRTNDI